MKLLLTGMAARGIGSTKTRHKITSLPDVLARALRDLGHEVEGPRRVRQDELYLVGEADAVLVQLGWVSSLSSTYAHEAGMVMALAAELGRPVVRYVDDWRSQWLADDIAGHVVSDRGWEKHTQRFRADAYRDLSAETVDDIRAAFCGPILGEKLVVPIMGWGDPSLFDVSTKARLSEVVPLDPQALCDRDRPLWAEDRGLERERRWIVASLQEHDRWVSEQGLSWPVERMGANRKLPGGVPVPGARNAVVPESEVLANYATAWGVLSPEYDSAGSGYWRTRWDQAMNAGSVIWPGSRDWDAAFGGALGVSSPAEIELLSTPQLEGLQAEQARLLDGAMWTPDRALGELDRIVREAE